VKIDLLWTVKNWLEYQELTHAIHIACKTCAMDITKSPVSLESEHKPFIIISTKTMEQVKQYLKGLQSVYLAHTVSLSLFLYLFISPN
jgi:hypothetical protein